ncbi:MAG: RING finger family 4 domain-containing protein [Kofleriaceae bacterium]
MDRIRTLLLARTSTVVLDPDRVAAAATRPSRDVDLDRFEDELVQLGYVMSLDLAMTVRRLPHQAIQELKTWILDTLANTVGVHRMPLDPKSSYAKRVQAWLAVRPVQPCPWCSQIRAVGALDACGHLVCRSCWESGSFSGCPICHRRIAITEPFMVPQRGELRVHRDGELRLLHLALDTMGTARLRFEHLLTGTTPLSKDDRAEVEAVIDTYGPRAALWVPATIPVKETVAIVVARLWMVSPDRPAMVKATQSHLRTATDVLRVAAVLMGAAPTLVRGVRFGPLRRGLRRAVLEALDRIDPDALFEDVMRHPGLWKRAGERLHPFEHAKRLPNVALAFAAVRGSTVAALSFAGELRTAAAAHPQLAVGTTVTVSPWAAPVEAALQAGDARTAAERLGERPNELLRRTDQLLRVTHARQPDALPEVISAIARAVAGGSASTLLVLGAHIAKRGDGWPRRVFFPRGDVLAAFVRPENRAALPADAIAAVVTAVRGELLARADGKRKFARAVLDRGLEDLVIPIGARRFAKPQLVWPRSSEVRFPAGPALRLTLHPELVPALVLYDASWRHVVTCDARNPVVGNGAAMLTGQHGDLDLAALATLGIRYVVMVVFGHAAHGFALLATPTDPSSAVRFELLGKAAATVPASLDLEARRLRWLDVDIPSYAALQAAGGYHAALAHVGRDFEDRAGTRPTLWDLASIHAAARANIIYIRERDATFTIVRRRDNETSIDRLARLDANEHDGQHTRIPPANAPTWVALLRDDLALPAGSAGYVLDGSGSNVLHRLDAADLVSELALR